MTFHKLSESSVGSAENISEDVGSKLEPRGGCLYILYRKVAKSLIIRPIKKNEIMLLTEFIYESIFQEHAEKLASRTVIQHPSIWIYIDGFGTKKDDYCFVAEKDSVIVGAVWVRCINGYGHIDDETPEFAISVYSDHRGKGIGTQLMKKMLEHLKLSGYTKTSLSVQKENKAVNLYLQVGFEIISENEEEFIMVHKLA